MNTLNALTEKENATSNKMNMPLAGGGICRRVTNQQHRQLTTFAVPDRKPLSCHWCVPKNRHFNGL